MRPRSDGRGLNPARSQRLLQTFYCDWKADQSLVTEEIDYGSHDTEHLHVYPLDGDVLDVGGKQGIGQPEEPDSRRVEFWRPVLLADSEPDSPRVLVGQTMEGKCRDEANNGLGNSLGRFGERVLLLDRGIGELVKASCQSKDPTFGGHPAERGGGHTLRAELGSAHHSAATQLALGASCLCFVTSDS